MSLFWLAKLFNLFLKIDRSKLDKELVGFQVAMDHGELQISERELDTHIEKYPRDEVALCHKAMILKSRGEIDCAIKYLKRSMKAHASYAESRYLLGKLYLEEEEFELARTYLSSGLNIKVLNDIILDLGKAYIGKGNYKDAIAFFKKTIRQNKNNLEAYKCLIETYYRIGKDKEAMKYEVLLQGIEEET